ncbi:T9SS type A sorting domain-containing protein [Algivirga pacifica]|uniref:Secretion system C-terminal sorting domain-containing protein n=1 Tax=Algivirga pacifica TaxID=1162670 RepID=A0ABP9D7F3_9BACT
MKTYQYLFVLLLTLGFTSLNAWSQDCGCDHTIPVELPSGKWDAKEVAPGDTICLAAGVRDYSLRLENVKGIEGNPITIKNCGGLVKFEVSTAKAYAIRLANCSFFRFTGTGDPSLTYGFEVIGGSMSIHAEERSSNFEIDHVEVHGSKFAGMMIKTDPQCNDSSTWGENFTMRNISIHDNLIYDTEQGQGLYIGHTSIAKGVKKTCGTLTPHLIHGAKVYNNTIRNTGGDGIQVGGATHDCEIYNNYIEVTGTSTLNNSAVQNHGIQIGEGTAGTCFNNTVIDARANGINCIGIGGNVIYNNVVVNAGMMGIEIDEYPETTLSSRSFYVYHNTVINAGINSMMVQSELMQGNFIHNNLWVASGENALYVPPNHNDLTTLDTAGNLTVTSIDQVAFVSPANHDYNLTATSTNIIDRGASVASFPFDTDKAGNPRVTGGAADPGAYEYNEIILLPPSVTAEEICSGQTAALLISNIIDEYTYYWYSDTLSSAIAEGDSFETGPLTSSKDYYVQSIRGEEESTYQVVTVNVTASPETPEIVNLSDCGSNSAELSVLTIIDGLSYNWYSSLSPMTLIGSGNSITVGDTLSTIYLQASNGSCESEFTSMELFTSITPETPSLSEIIVCYGMEATLSVDDPNDSLTYEWFIDTLSNTADYSGSSIYIEEVDSSALYVRSNSNGCVSSFVSVPMQLSSIEIEGTVTDNNITISVNGGSAPYTYAWSNSNGFIGSSKDLSDVAPDIYTLYVFDANGCSTEESFTISAIECTLNVAISSNETVLTASANGGTSEYSYSWSGPNDFTATGDEITAVSSGQYIVIAQSGNCFASDTVDVEIMTPCDLQVEGNVVKDVISSNVQGGTAPYTYLWSGPNDFSSTDSTITAPVSGNYILIVSDREQCQDTASFEVFISEICSLEVSGTVDEAAITTLVEGGNGEYTYLWVGPENFSSSEANIVAPISGEYTVFVSSSNDCFAQASFTVEVNTPVCDLSIQASIVDYNISTTVSGGFAPYTYVWSGPDNFSSNEASIVAPISGRYTLIVTDSEQSCADTAQFDITVPEPCQVSLSGVINDNIITTNVEGGLAPYTYSWSGPDNFTSIQKNITAPVSGDYTVIVKDANDCSDTASFSVTIPEVCALTAEGEVQQYFIDLNSGGGTAPYTYSWSGPNNFSATTEDVLVPTSGTYTVTVSDANNCSITTSFLVEAAEVCELNINGTIDGNTITTSVNGGSGSYTYLWSGPEKFTSEESSITASVSGKYIVFVSESDGSCLDSATFNIEVKAPCTLQVDGSVQGDLITTTVSGSSSTYSYFWQGPNNFISNKPYITAPTSGTYIVFVSDYENCMDSASFLVDLPEQCDLQVSGSITDNAIYTTITGGTAPYSYFWQGPNNFITNKANITAPTSGNYTVFVSDNKGCLDSATFAISIEEECDLQVSGTITDNSIDITTTGGNAPYTYQWSGPNNFQANTATVEVSASGRYMVIVYSGEECFDFAYFDVTVSDSTSNDSSFVCTMSLLDNSVDSLLSVIITNGTAPYSYQWSGPNSFSSQDEQIIAIDSGLYYLLVIDSMQCVSNIAINFTPSITDSTTLIACEDVFMEALVKHRHASSNGTADGSLSITIEGGNAPYTYRWSGPNGYSSTSPSIDNLASGEYTVSITDNNLCTERFTYMIGYSSSDSNTTEDSTCQQTPLIEIASVQLPTTFGSTDGILAVTVTGGAARLSYDWSGPNGFAAKGSTIYGLQAGMYHLMTTDTEGCRQYFSYAFNSRLGAKSAETTYSISPNPAQNEVFIARGKLGQNTPVYLYNTNGQVIHQGYISGNQYKIDGLQTLPNGVYFIQIQEAEQSIMKKVIIQH